MLRFTKSFAFLTALALLAAWSSSSRAANDEARATRGTIKSVNADKNQLTLSDRNNKDWTFQVMTNAAIFTPDQQNAQLSAFKAGEEVSLLWEKRDGHLYASSILLHQGEYRNANLAAGLLKNVANNQFTATDAKGKALTFRLGDNARVYSQGKTAKLSDFDLNSHVAIVYEKADDQYRVRAMAPDPVYPVRNR